MNTSIIISNIRHIRMEPFPRDCSILWRETGMRVGQGNSDRRSQHFLSRHPNSDLPLGDTRRAVGPEIRHMISVPSTLVRDFQGITEGGRIWAPRLTIPHWGPPTNWTVLLSQRVRALYFTAMLPFGVSVWDP